MKKIWMDPKNIKNLGIREIGRFPVRYLMCAYSRRSYIHFQCGICGRMTRAEQRVPQCMVCMLPLCDGCNHSGFCRTHFHLLSPGDQALATQQYDKMVTSKRVMLGCVFGGMIIFLMVMFGGMSLSFSHMYSSTYSPVFILLPLIIFLPLIVGGAGYYQVTIKKTWQFLEEIGRKYKGLGEAPLGAPFSPLPPQQPVQPATPFSTPSVDPLQTRFCAQCGAPWVPGARFCRYCGQGIE